MKIKEIMPAWKQVAPKALQESYDNSGLLIGRSRQRDTKKALICLDLTMEVLDEAIRMDIGMIISHHPLIFSGLKSFTGANETEQDRDKSDKK